MAHELTVVNELDVLTSFETVAALFARDVDGRCRLLPGSAHKASVWYPDCVADKGGHPIPGWWQDDPEILCDPVQLFRLRDAFYAPGFGAVISPHGAVMEHTVAQARFITPDLTGLPCVSEKGGRVIFDPPETLPHLDTAVVTMPWGAIYNYGHFLCDCLTSVAQLDQLSEVRDYVRVGPPLKAWQRRHFELLGVAPVELDQPLYHVSDLLFPSGMSYFLNRPNTNYRVLRAAQLRNKQPTDVSFGKVYISRTRVTIANSDRRRFLSEAALERELAAREFQIVTPELYKLDEQLDLFHNSRVIVACRGAALANVIYCRPNTTIIEIIPTIAGFEGYQWVRDICAMMGCRWRPYFVEGIPPKEPWITAGQVRPNAGFTFDVDIPDLLSFIERSI
jgi:capsular polysaccharide biosynthesis protein